MESKMKLREGEVFDFLVKRLQKDKSEIANDLNISVQTLSKAFASEFLTRNIKQRAAAYLKVPESFFTGWYMPSLSDMELDVLNEPESPLYDRRVHLDTLTASEVMRYLEDKDRRHYEERARLLGIIENLTKK